MRKFPSKLTTLAAACILANVAYANGGTVQTHQRFPMHPRTTIQGSGGQFGFFEGDMMSPLYGNEEGIFYIDAMGKYATNSSWMGSVGLGLRQVRGEHLWGAYVFGDRSESEFNKDFWVVNPGVELFTNAWDFHLNGYIPTDERERLDGIFFGGDLGIPTYVHFKGHKQFDNLFKRYEEVGPGVDGEVGYSLLHNKRTRIYLGGYYFDPDHAHDITGVEGGVEVPLDNHFSVIVEDSYDDVEHNTARFTLRMTLGGIPKPQQQTVRDRILDPIPRHLGTLNTGMGIPSQKTFVNTGVRALYRDNIWFFKPNGAPYNGGLGPEDCTFENPCSGSEFTQSNVNAIDGIAPGANFYFSPGSYPDFDGIGDRLQLHNGQSMYGRTEDYRLAAFWGNAFPVFTGGIDPEGNNTLEAFQILNNAGDPQAIGINIENTQNVYINHVIVGSGIAGMDSSVGNPGGNFQTAIQMDNAQNVVITNSTLNAEDDRDGTVGNKIATATGIKAINNSQFKLKNSKIYVKANVDGDVDDILVANAIGIDVENSQAWLSHNWVNLEANATNAYSDFAPDAAVAYTTGIIADSNNGGSTTVNSRGDSFSLNNTANANNYTGNAYAYGTGIIADSNNGGSTTVNSSGDSFSLNNTANANGDKFGVAKAQAAGIIADSDEGTTTVNSRGDCFSLNNTANANDENGYAKATTYGLSAYSYDATTTVNSRGDSFSLNNMANANGKNGYALAIGTGLNAYSYSKYGAATATMVNSRGDSFSLNNKANANGKNGVASAYGVGLSAGSKYGNVGDYSGITTKVNSRGDSFSLNNTANANGYKGRAAAGAYGIIAFSSFGTITTVNSRGDSFSSTSTANANGVDGYAYAYGTGIYAGSIFYGATTTVNATGDTFNIAANANGSNAIASVVGVSAYAYQATTRVNIFKNRFNLSAKQNGANGTIQDTVVAGDGAVIVAQGNKFHHKS